MLSNMNGLFCTSYFLTSMGCSVPHAFLHGWVVLYLILSNIDGFFCKPRSLTFAMKSKVVAEINRLVDENIIEPVSHSDWAAPVVPVLKLNGEIRFFGDYKVTINKVSNVEQYPIPTLEELTSQIAAGTVYHKLDLSMKVESLLLSIL